MPYARSAGIDWFSKNRMNSSRRPGLMRYLRTSTIMLEKIGTKMLTRQKALSGNRPNPVRVCPQAAALAAIGGKGKLIIVYSLAESSQHFAALRKAMAGISQKVLTEQLRELIAADTV